MKTVLKAAEKFVTDNSPGILTGLGVAGTVTTAVLTGKAAYSAALKIADERDAFPYEPSFKQKSEMVWKEFIPPAIAGVATITCIIAANQIGSRRAAAIAAAFKLSEQLSEEYKERVVKTLGLQKEEKMRSELAGEKIAQVPGAGMIVVAGSEVLFYDELSGRVFKGELEAVRKAVNEVNYKINNYYSASLTDFYEMIGLTRTEFSDEVGWNTDELLEVTYTATLFEGKPAISISYNRTPIRGYDRCQ
jgi:hypothetical protein